MAVSRSFISVMILVTSMLCSRAIAADLQGISFAKRTGGGFEVLVDFSAPPNKPREYTTAKPARIVLDFADVENRLAEREFPLALENAQKVVVVPGEAGAGQVRLIIELTKLAAYSTRIEKNRLVVAVDAASRYTVRETTNRPFSTGDENSIKDIDFRRGEDGEGRVLLTLGSAKIDIDVEETASGIVINFADTRIPNALRRRLDVNDFATPVNVVEADAEGGNAVIVVKAKGDFDYFAYQTDNTYILNVKPLTPAEAEEKKARFAFVGEKLSLNFQDIEVRSVLQIIADFTELNLVASDTVDGRITLRLENVPWDQALDLVLKAKGLDKRQIGNVLMVAPAAEIAERERQELETRRQLRELAPLRTEYIRLKYADANSFLDLFDIDKNGEEDDSKTSFLSERGSVIVDTRTNSILLTDTEEKINEFMLLIEKIDIPIRQVMIESRIVVASNDFRRELGMTISGNATDTLGTDDIVTTTGGVNLGLDAATSQVGINVLGDNFLLDLELAALESDEFAEIIAQPKVITGDKQQATIESGTEIPYVSSDGDTVTTVFRDAVLKLDVTPQITPDDRIIMLLKINQDSPGVEVSSGFGTTVPTIDTTELQTRVLVGDGQTIVLGGIFTQNETNTVSKVPLLGDIPYLGRLFRRDVNDNEKQEILIFITPRILSENLID